MTERGILCGFIVVVKNNFGIYIIYVCYRFLFSLAFMKGDRFSSERNQYEIS
jgi:hypothetical protein